MMSSLLIFGIAANAQDQYRAEIPFDFQAAGVTHKAGEYSVGRISPATPVLVIRNRKSTKSIMLGHANLGGVSRDANGKLIFLKADGRYTLSEIKTPSFAMKLRKTKTDVRMAGGSTPKMETVAINLH